MCAKNIMALNVYGRLFGCVDHSQPITCLFAFVSSLRNHARMHPIFSVCNLCLLLKCAVKTMHENGIVVR